MPDILIRSVPQRAFDALKERAKQNRRSLQQELLGILEVIAEESIRQNPAQLAAAIRTKLAQRARAFSDSTELLREDRER